MVKSRVDEEDQSSIVRYLEEHSTPEQRELMVNWANSLLAIRASCDSVPVKVKRAVAVTVQRDTIFPMLTLLATSLKKFGWDDRDWVSRLGVGGTVAALAIFGSQAAGVAALGGAIAVPLWVIFGTGATIAGLLIDRWGAASPMWHKTTVTCPQCSQPLRVPSRKLLQIRCASCHHEFQRQT